MGSFDSSIDRYLVHLLLQLRNNLVLLWHVHLLDVDRLVDDVLDGLRFFLRLGGGRDPERWRGYHR